MKVDWNKPLEMVLFTDDKRTRPCVKRGILDDGKIVVNLEGTPNSLWIMNPDGSCSVGTRVRVQNAPSKMVKKTETRWVALFRSKNKELYTTNFQTEPQAHKFANGSRSTLLSLEQVTFEWEEEETPT